MSHQIKTPKDLLTSGTAAVQLVLAIPAYRKVFMSRIDPAAMLTALFVLASQLGAQNSPPAPPAPAIHTTVNEVALDLEIRDKKGKLVKNLGPADVEIYEDGVRQQIRGFRLVNAEDAPA